MSREGWGAAVCNLYRILNFDFSPGSPAVLSRRLTEWARERPRSPRAAGRSDADSEQPTSHSSDPRDDPHWPSAAAAAAGERRHGSSNRSPPSSSSDSGDSGGSSSDSGTNSSETDSSSSSEEAHSSESEEGIGGGSDSRPVLAGAAADEEDGGPAWEAGGSERSYGSQVSAFVNGPCGLACLGPWV